MKQFVGAHMSPASAFAGLKRGMAVHGLSDGSWSLSDGISELLRIVGKSHLVISTWTASNADLEKAAGFLRDDRIATIRLLVDRSFEGRQPKYCAAMRGLFGDEAVRVWSSHAKFVVIHGGRLDLLYLTSANLNANKRLENYSVVAGGSLPLEYLTMVREVFERQKPGEAWGAGARRCRSDTEAVLAKRVPRRG